MGRDLSEETQEALITFLSTHFGYSAEPGSIEGFGQDAEHIIGMFVNHRTPSFRLRRYFKVFPHNTRDTPVYQRSFGKMETSTEIRKWIYFRRDRICLVICPKKPMK